MKRLILSCALITPALIFSNITPIYAIAVILLSITSGLIIEFRNINEHTRLIIFSIIAVLSLAFSLYFYNITQQLDAIIIIKLLFLNILVFPIIGNLASKTQLNKLLGVSIIFMTILFISGLSITSSLRTNVERHGIGYFYNIEFMNNMEAMRLINTYPSYLSLYVCPAYVIKSSLFNYGLSRIEVIGIRGYYYNSTHCLILIGSGISISVYKTEFGKPIISGLNLKHEINYNTNTDWGKLIHTVEFNSFYMNNFLFLFDLPKDSIINVVLNDTWIIKEIIANDNKTVKLNRPIVIQHIINITITEKIQMFTTRFSPEEIYFETLVFHAKYSPKFSITEFVLFYKYEISLVLLVIVFLMIAIEHNIPENILIEIRKLKSEMDNHNS